jgi:hypothetical protein
MKQTILLITCVSIVVVGYIVLIVFGNGNQAHSHGNGALPGYTGSIADGQTCTSCHGGAPLTNEIGLISSSVPVTGYVPNTTYTITATITRAGHTKFGFEVSPQNAAGNLQGTLINTSTETKLVGTGKYVTHTSSGTAGVSGSKSWSFNWTSPAQGTGNVTFYGAFNITNSNSATSGDSITTSTLIIPENLTVGINESDSYANVELSPNPATSFIKVNSSTTIIKNIEIYNLNGQLVVNEQFKSDLINVEALKEGMYIVKLNTQEGKSILKKIIIN